ncbi:FAD-binding oxidoreductase [Catellatospora coxensis]|uniref:Alkyldihydroxyacetonephosphate synthase n=1 Tax=Catellatospora coxensis TaxID=310354 RepID=A0A8J3PAI5_9ACTN|nr:FAD-binding oxidoreductase [Catellatospora coxensis]GIG07871.1 alkyldihydroxyacetonephosphate synthase [Catellatospora coxensis]
MREERRASWARWGTPEHAKPLPEAVAGLLKQVFDVTPPGPATALDAVAAPAPALAEPALAALVAVVGAEHVSTEAAERALHASGKSTPDLFHQRTGELPALPAAVVAPADHDQVLAVLAVCAEHRLAVVPFGGGTSVVGGLTPEADGHVTLDLRRLDRLVAVDPVSRTAVLQAGLPAPRADELLAEHGFTLGHVPQSYEYATIGGFAATRSSGQASAGYGRFDDMVVGLTVATPRGTISTGRAPASSAGPDLRRLFLGSEGAFGVITDVTVRVRPLAAERHYEGWRFESFADGVAAARRLAQDGPRPTVLRLSDEVETMLGAAGRGRGDGGCLLVVGHEGASVGHAVAQTAAVLRECGGQELGPEPGEQWAAHRFDAPYLRDALLDAGAFAETLETAAFWSALPGLYEAVREALFAALPVPSMVLCHVSHVYETGASLYFTVVTAYGDEPVARWQRAKAAANDAIIAAGGTISHHHGVGTEHRDWFAQEIGPLGVDVLRAVKRELDPAGVLNPGVLVEHRLVP